MSELFGLGGLARAGKDTVADYLVSGYGFVKIGMSDPLWDVLLTLDPVVEFVYTGLEHVTPERRVSDILDMLNDDRTEAKSQFPEIRRLLQVLGTEVGRAIDEDLWVNLMLDKVTETMNRGSSVVVTGIRFPNELEAIGAAGGWTVWVERAAEGVGAGNHASETSVEDADFEILIENNGTLGALYHQVDRFLGEASIR